MRFANLSIHFKVNQKLDIVIIDSDNKPISITETNYTPQLDIIYGDNFLSRIYTTINDTLGLLIYFAIASTLVNFM